MSLLFLQPCGPQLFLKYVFACLIDFALQVRHPYVSWTFSSVLELTSSSFLLRTRGATELELKGQFLPAQMQGQDVLLFMGSVRLSCLEELQVRMWCGHQGSSEGGAGHQAKEHAMHSLCRPRIGEMTSPPPHTQRCNLYLSDIPPHDMARDFVLLAEQLKVESDLKEKLEVRGSKGEQLKVKGKAHNVGMSPKYQGPISLAVHTMFIP